MKVQDFDYFTKVQASYATQKSSSARVEDFDMDFQPVSTGYQPVDTPASGWTCTLVCHITALICPTKSCS